MDADGFHHLSELLRAESEMLRAHLEAWAEHDQAWEELEATGGGWGGRLSDALASVDTFEEWEARHPTVEWWRRAT